MKSSFEWDHAKDQVNKEKHGVSFALAQLAFLDARRVTLEDLDHSGKKTVLLFGKGCRRNLDRPVYLAEE